MLVIYHQIVGTFYNSPHWHYRQQTLEDGPELSPAKESYQHNFATKFCSSIMRRIQNVGEPQLSTSSEYNYGFWEKNRRDFNIILALFLKKKNREHLSTCELQVTQSAKWVNLCQQNEYTMIQYICKSHNPSTYCLVTLRKIKINLKIIQTNQREQRTLTVLVTCSVNFSIQ